MRYKKEELFLFDIDEYDWYIKEWVGMPEFSQEDLMPWKTIKIHFINKDDLAEFTKLVNQNITDTTQFIWFPKASIEIVKNKRYVDE